MIEIYTDGSASPNPGPGGYAYIIVHNDKLIYEQTEASVGETTNNRMEWTAINKALGYLKEAVLEAKQKAEQKAKQENNPLGILGTVSIHTDSKLCEQTLNSWAAGWKKRGWKRKTGPIKNLDLVKEGYELFVELQQYYDLSINWIKAHAGHKWNEYVDTLANKR